MDSKQKVFKVTATVITFSDMESAYSQNVLARTIEEAMTKFRRAARKRNKAEKWKDVRIHNVNEHCDIDII